MTNLKGKSWSELTEAEKEELLKSAYVDKSNMDKKTGECIIDFIDTNLSIAGLYIVGEEEDAILPNTNAKLYDSTEGI